MTAETTSVTVKKSTRAALGALATYEESMDDVIMRLVNQAKAPAKEGV